MSCKSIIVFVNLIILYIDYSNGLVSCYRYGSHIRTKEQYKRPLNSSEIGSDWCNDKQCNHLHTSLPDGTMCIRLSWGKYTPLTKEYRIYDGYEIGVPVTNDQAVLMGCEGARYLNTIGPGTVTVTKMQVRRILQLIHYFSYKGPNPWMTNETLKFGLKLPKFMMHYLNEIEVATFSCCTDNSKACNSPQTHIPLGDWNQSNCSIFLYDETHEFSYLPPYEFCVSNQCFQAGMQVRSDASKDDFVQVVWGGCLTDANKFPYPFHICPRKRDNMRCKAESDNKSMVYRFVQPLFQRVAVDLSPAVDPNPPIGWKWQATAYRALEKLEELIYKGDYKKVAWCCQDAPKIDQPERFNGTVVFEYLKKKGGTSVLKDEF